MEPEALLNAFAARVSLSSADGEWRSRRRPHRASRRTSPAASLDCVCHGAGHFSACGSPGARAAADALPVIVVVFVALLSVATRPLTGGQPQPTYYVIGSALPGMQVGGVRNPGLSPGATAGRDLRSAA